MNERFTLPVLPLRNTVVFPGVAIPISAGRPGTVAAVERALKGDERLFAVTQHEDEDDVDTDGLYRIGTVIRILQTHQVRDGMQLLVQGESRAQAYAYDKVGESMLMAVLSPLERIPPGAFDDPTFQALDHELRQRAAELGTRRGMPAEAVSQFVKGIDDPGTFADLVAFYLQLPIKKKQELLETLDDETRMRRTLVAVQRELTRIGAQEKIQAQVQEELGERQREILLREQMKVIQKELGDTDDQAEAEELRERLDALELPKDVRAEAERELKRLERTNPQSAEYQVIRTYLEWFTELPWNTRTEDKIDLAKAEQILDEDHYGLEDVKDRVLEFLAVRKLQLERFAEDEAAVPASAKAGGRTAQRQPDGDEGDGEVQDDAERDRARSVGRGPILLFAGPPGVGKTSIAQSIARSLGRKYVRISLGGARDEADIRGHRRTYVGAMPGRIIQGMRQVKSKNPVFLLDEVDKLGQSYQGDPSAALLEVLDPAQNNAFTDHYLGVPFDLSEVLFIATANYLDRIPGPLLDRMEVVNFAGYTELEKLEIARRYLLERQRRDAGLRADELTVTEGALTMLIQRYTREAGVRQLEREVGRLARKSARRIAAGEVQQLEVDETGVREMLGRPRLVPEEKNPTDVVGVATGMTYTPMGGDIIFIEASVMPGGEKFVLTGQLGDVMKESGRAALTWAKTHHEALGIPAEAFRGVDLHVHVPAGAVPKDGPSAGVTMATAMVSAITKRPVRHDIAMTGEITLTGRVLPVGGIKEKLLGATRAGIWEIILPYENEAYLEDLPAEVRGKLQIHLVRELDEVMKLALRDKPAGPA